MASRLTRYPQKVAAELSGPVKTSVGATVTASLMLYPVIRTLYAITHQQTCIEGHQ